MWLLLTLSCAQAPADAFLAYVRTEGGYEVRPRELPGLTDPSRMAGGLGEVRTGGQLSINDQGEFDYRQGRPLDLRYQVVDGVAWPMDEDGLVLFSFWGHLADTASMLEDSGLGLGEVLPVQIAWVPTLPDPMLELYPAENAAYATGGNIFVLLPDGREDGVPLVANAGVVAHETGHALFQLLTTGDPYAPSAWNESDPIGGSYQSALHEGFADAVAAMLLDDPRFMESSIDAVDRRLDGAASLAAGGVTLPEDFDASGLFSVYDPYPLGTVFASIAWDIRMANDDPTATLGLVADAAVVWTDGLLNGWDDTDRFSFADALLLGTRGDVRVAACASATLRLPDVALRSCPP